jgi:hypothetical protein
MCLWRVLGIQNQESGDSEDTSSTEYKNWTEAEPVMAIHPVANTMPLAIWRTGRMESLYGMTVTTTR